MNSLLVILLISTVLISHVASIQCNVGEDDAWMPLRHHNDYCISIYPMVGTQVFMMGRRGPMPIKVYQALSAQNKDLRKTTHCAISTYGDLGKSLVCYCKSSHCNEPRTKEQMLDEYF